MKRYILILLISLIFALPTVNGQEGVEYADFSHGYEGDYSWNIQYSDDKVTWYDAGDHGCLSNVNTYPFGEPVGAHRYWAFHFCGQGTLPSKMLDFQWFILDGSSYVEKTPSAGQISFEGTYVLFDATTLVDGISTPGLERDDNSEARIIIDALDFCTESWTCTDWSSCVNNEQTRACNDVNICGTTNNKPNTRQSCTVTCTESWTCDEWSSCVDGEQTRTCNDANSCGTTTDKLAETQTCTITVNGQEGVEYIDFQHSGEGDYSWNIQYSEDKRAWHDACPYMDVSGRVDSGSDLPDRDGAHRYWAMNINDGQGTSTVKVYEFQWFTSDGEKNPLPSQILYAFRTDDEPETFFDPSKLIDGDSSTLGFQMKQVFNGRIIIDTLITCTESWTCDDWENCVDNQETRSCTDQNNCGTTINKPVETRSCGCTPKWECSINPITCPEDGLQTKVCKDVVCSSEDTREVIGCVPEGIKAKPKAEKCDGCLLDGTCVSFGFRREGKYCDLTKNFYPQKKSGETCDNNFECATNTCSKGVCIDLEMELKESMSFLKKIWCRILHPFSSERYISCMAE